MLGYGRAVRWVALLLPVAGLVRASTLLSHTRGSLFPGIPEMDVPKLNKVARDAGVEPQEITHLHSGKIHVCQPWENCEGAAAAVANVTEVTVTVAPQVLGTYQGHECPEWGPTEQGCHCMDYCACNKGGQCETKIVMYTDDDGNPAGAKCGTLAGAGAYMDTCKKAPESIKVPFASTMKIPKITTNSTHYREFNNEGNKRFLPKKMCWSRDYYCASFPNFPGCNPARTYRTSDTLTEEQRAEIEKCGTFSDQKPCEEHKKCGEGAHGTCYPTCLWGEDAPWWFRELRGKQNMWIKRTHRDPVKSGVEGKRGPRKYIPVLQPGSAGVPGQIDQSLFKGKGYKYVHPSQKRNGTKSGDEDATAAADGAAATTPAPVYVRAGEVGTRRSAGWVRAGMVGKDIGSDTEAKGRFRPLKLR